MTYLIIRTTLLHAALVGSVALMACAGEGSPTGPSGSSRHAPPSVGDIEQPAPVQVTGAATMESTNASMPPTGSTALAAGVDARTWWRSLSPFQRADLIVAETRTNRSYRDNCKEWARSAISNASRGVVSLPATVPNASGYQFGPSMYLMAVGNIRNVRYGDIIQHNWKTSKGGNGGPHTMIVTSPAPNVNGPVNGFGVTEANWPTAGHRSRWMSYIDFEKNSIAYTVYRVIGG